MRATPRREAARPGGELREHGYGLLILVHQAVPTPAEGDLRLLSEMVHLAGNTVRGAVAIVTRGVGHATPAALIAMAGDGKDAVRAFFDGDDARRWLATFRTP